MYRTYHACVRSTKKASFYTLRERLLYLLAELGLTHAAFTAAIGVNHSQISSWMTGRSKMPQSTAMAFQAVYGVRWQWLLNGDGEPWLAQWEFLPDDLKELAALWPALSNEDRQYVLGVAEGRAAKGTK